MRAFTASVVGIPSKTTWSTTATIKADNREFLLACGFSGDEQAPHEGRKLVRLVENLPNTTAPQVYKALEEFVKNLPDSVAASMAVLLKEDGKTILFTYGYALAGLLRSGGGRWLADGSAEKVVLEGQLNDGDQFLLATARAKDLRLDLSQLTKYGPEDIAAGLFSSVQSNAGTGEIAILLVKFSQDQNVVISPSESEPPKFEESQNISLPTTSAPTRHLISPEKIEQGVLASQTEQVSRINTSLKSRDWLGSVQRQLRHKGNFIKFGIAIGVVIVLLSSMLIYRSASVAAEYDAVVAPLEQLVDEAINLPQDQIAQQRATVQSLVERIGATRASYGANQRRLRELLATVTAKNNEISGEKALVNLPIFYDFRLVSADFLATKASREKNRAVFLDSGSSALIVLNLDTKQNETYPREGLSQPVDVAMAESIAFVLEPERVAKSTPTASNVTTQGLLSGVREPMLLDRFGEALYILDRSGQQIWRLAITDDATPSGWIRSARGIDFTTVNSMSINGSVWLSSTAGEIYKLVRGERENFNVTGLVTPFTSPILLATTPEGEKLIAVEPGKKRMVVFNKDGEYQLQVESEQIGAVTDVFLSEDERGVYLVAGSVVYKVDI